MEPIPYPLRINRYLALKGIASRREADRLIEKSLVFINGKRARIGDNVEERDIVEVKGTGTLKYLYALYHKPRGMLTHSATKGEKEVSIIIDGIKLAPVGRLDKDSEGLILLSNDGRIVQRLLDPEHEHEKEYVVDVDVPLKPSFKNRMERGVVIEGYKTRPSKVKVLGETSFSIILTEGKKHQIRRMCAALGYQIKNLKRIRIENLRLGSLKPGTHRKLTATEQSQLLRKLGF